MPVVGRFSVLAINRSGLPFALAFGMYKAPALLCGSFTSCLHWFRLEDLPFFSRYISASAFKFDDLVSTCAVLCLVPLSYSLGLSWSV